MAGGYQAFAIAGRRYDLRHSGAMQVPGHYCEAEYAVDGITVPLRSSTHDMCWQTAVGILGTMFRSSYALGAGTVHVGDYQEIDPELGALAIQHVALWTDGAVALWTEAETRSGDWLAELLGELRPERAATSVVARDIDVSAVTVHHEDVLVTVAEVGAIGLYPETRWRTATDLSGLRTPAGELFRGDEREAYVDVRDGVERVVDKVYLRSPTTVAKLDLVETTPDGAVEFMSGFTKVTCTR